MLAAGVLVALWTEEVDVAAHRWRLRRLLSSPSPQPVDTGVDSRRRPGQGRWAGDHPGGRSRPGTPTVASEGTA